MSEILEVSLERSRTGSLPCMLHVLRLSLGGLWIDQAAASRYTLGGGLVSVMSRDAS
jgi:hypothetical protein